MTNQIKHKFASGIRDNQKLWAARITGIGGKYGLRREFDYEKIICDTSSKHNYFDGYINIKEGEIFEVCYGYGGKYREFLTLENGEVKEIESDEVMKKFN